MTRSDLLLAVHRLDDKTCPDRKILALIMAMYNKIENAYEIVFALEADKDFKELGEALRKALES